MREQLDRLVAKWTEDISEALGRLNGETVSISVREGILNLHRVAYDCVHDINHLVERGPGRPGVLRPAVDVESLKVGLKELKDSAGLEAVLHLLEGAAVMRSANAGVPGVEMSEAKAEARAAQCLRDFYAELVELVDRPQDVE